jgi:Pentatricopeptide repeat domain
MRIQRASMTAWLALFCSTSYASAFTPLSRPAMVTSAIRASTAEDLVLEIGASFEDDGVPIPTRELTMEVVSKLKWRDLQYELQARELATSGTTAMLRDRLLESADLLPTQKPKSAFEAPDSCPPGLLDIDFIDASDPFSEVLNDVVTEANRGYWKKATRRLKKLSRRYSETHCIPVDAYLVTLNACAQDRLHGARASESARKIMEEMVNLGYQIPTDQLNYCVRGSLGYGPNGTHEGFGGIDTALAMLAAIGQQEAVVGEPLVSVETYGRIIEALAREGGSSINDALKLLRSVVVDKRETPPLSAFAAVAFAEAGATTAEVKSAQEEDVTIGPENVFNVIAYVKAAGYELDKIASTEDGRRIIAAGVIAAEKMNNVRLGLRLLQAASQASGCAPDRGDVLVAASSRAAQRACTLVHKRAINTAVEEGQWQLAVKLLQIMMERALKPSPMVWRNVVTCCAKNEKSKKATAVLLDWVKLYEDKKAEKPPINVFNTCVNACEVCGEQELTIPVLEAMKKTHKTDGNIITFNIALKRLARLGNHWATEGIIIGMLQSNIEPTVVSYTTAIAACAAAETKQPTLAYQWMQRMRSRQVNPNVITYNTALAACLDGSFASTQLASKIATEMLADVDKQLISATAGGGDRTDEYTNVIPDFSTKAIARQLMIQLKQNWVDGAIDKQLAKATLRVPLLQLVEFSKSKAAEEAAEQAAEKAQAIKQSEDQLDATRQAEVALEYSDASKAHRTAEV